MSGVPMVWVSQYTAERLETLLGVTKQRRTT